MAEALDAGPLYLIAGVANEASIAWGVAQRILAAGHPCMITSLAKNLHRVHKLVTRAGFEAEVVALDVSDDASLRQLAETVESSGRRIAGVLHAIAYARIEDLQGSTLGVSRAGFIEAMNVSVYSLLALLRSVRPWLDAGSSIVALSYHGSQRCISGYDLMGIAKAALESACRYLANELGRDGIRVNCASPGPMLTLSSSAFEDIQEKIERAAELAPLRSVVRMEDVASVVWHLLSQQSAGVTGQVLYVDNGLSILGG